MTLLRSIWSSHHYIALAFRNGWEKENYCNISWFSVKYLGKNWQFSVDKSSIFWEKCNIPCSYFPCLFPDCHLCLAARKVIFLLGFLITLHDEVISLLRPTMLHRTCSNLCPATSTFFLCFIKTPHTLSATGLLLPHNLLYLEISAISACFHFRSTNAHLSPVSSGVTYLETPDLILRQGQFVLTLFPYYTVLSECYDILFHAFICLMSS